MKHISEILPEVLNNIKVINMNPNKYKNELVATFLKWHKNKYGMWSRVNDLVMLDGEEYSENWFRDLPFDKDWNLFLEAWKEACYTIVGNNEVKAKLIMAIADVNIENAFNYLVELIEFNNQQAA